MRCYYNRSINLGKSLTEYSDIIKKDEKQNSVEDKANRN